MWSWFREKLSNMDNNIFGYYLFSPFSLHSFFSNKYTEQVPSSILRGIVAYQNIEIDYIYSGIFFLSEANILEWTQTVYGAGERDGGPVYPYCLLPELWTQQMNWAPLQISSKLCHGIEFSGNFSDWSKGEKWCVSLSKYEKQFFRSLNIFLGTEQYFFILCTKFYLFNHVPISEYLVVSQFAL